MDGSAHADRSEVRHPGSAGAATRPILVAQIREMDAGLHLSAPGAGQAEGSPTVVAASEVAPGSRGSSRRRPGPAVLCLEHIRVQVGTDVNTQVAGPGSLRSPLRA